MEQVDEETEVEPYKAKFYQFRPSGIFCCRVDGLELVARLSIGCANKNQSPRKKCCISAMVVWI